MKSLVTRGEVEQDEEQSSIDRTSIDRNDMPEVAPAAKVEAESDDTMSYFAKLAAEA